MPPKAHRVRSSRVARPRGREAKRSRVPLIALAVGAVVLAAVGALWLANRGGRAPAAATTPGASPSASPAATPTRDVTVVSVPASYSDPAVARFAAQLRAPALRSRVEAAESLAALGPRAREAVPALLNAMARKNSEIEFARAVSKAIKAIGPAAVPPLAAALRSGNPQARFHAAAALNRLGPDGAGATDALIEVLEGDEDMTVRSNAAVALGAIGPAASAALPALKRAAGNPNERLGGNAAKAELRVRAQMAIDQIKGTIGK